MLSDYSKAPVIWKLTSVACVPTVSINISAFLESWDEKGELTETMHDGFPETFQRGMQLLSQSLSAPLTVGQKWFSKLSLSEV